MRNLGGPSERHAPEVRRSGARVSRSRELKLTDQPDMLPTLRRAKGGKLWYDAARSIPDVASQARNGGCSAGYPVF